MHFTIVFSVAFLVSLLSSMSGAGATMFTTPVWLFLGFPLPVAIASNRLNGGAWTLVAARNYLRHLAIHGHRRTTDPRKRAQGRSIPCQSRRRHAGRAPGIRGCR